MKYGINDRPPFGEMLLYGLQWLVVTLPTLVIMGAVISKIHYTDTAEQTLYVQKLFGLMGATTVIQVLWGHRLPLVIGPASVLLIGILVSLSSGIEAIYTSIALGGLFVFLLSVSGLLTRLLSIFTKRVVVVILLLIPFTLMPVILKLVFANNNTTGFNLAFSFGMVFLLILCNIYLRGVWKSTAVIWGILAGTLVYFLCHGLPVAAPFVEAGSQSLPAFFLTRFDFDVGTIVAFLFCFIALVVNELGSIEAVAQLLQAGDNAKRLKYGLGVTGISNILAGSMGIIGAVDYSMGVGVITTTECASRYTLIPTGVVLICCAFMAPIINYFNQIPEIVMGALLLYLMATQLSSGILMLAQNNAVQNIHNGVVIGLPIMTAMLISFAPEVSLAQIPELLRPILGNGFVMGVVMVLLLEHLFFKPSAQKRP